MIHGDPISIRQVIHNLIKNALEAIEDVGQIDIDIHRVQKNNIDFIEIALHDDGVGIKDDQLEQIFEPYVTTKVKGTGLEKFLTTAFSRITEQTIKDIIKNGLPKSLLDKGLTTFKEGDFKTIFAALQKTELQAPSTKSVLTVGEESLSKSIMRLGNVDFFSVMTRKPTICDFKPVSVEVALARFLNRGDADNPVQVLRFANRVPLQFDKSACAISRAIETVNWKNYGMNQPKDSLPLGPYVFAVSVVSPFIKFKNASKETIDSSDELVEEIRRALMQAGQKLSRHIRKEEKEADLERT